MLIHDNYSAILDKTIFFILEGLKLKGKRKW